MIEQRIGRLDRMGRNVHVPVTFVVIHTTESCEDQLFTADHPDYEIDVKLCAFTASEMQEATKEHETFYRNSI